MTEFHVGQRVFTRNVDGKAVIPARITKVGRTLVTIVEDRYARPDARGVQYRMDTQHVNDQYGYAYFSTEEQIADEQARDALVHRIDTAYPQLGVRGWRLLPLPTLRAITELLEASKEK